MSIDNAQHNVVQAHIRAIDYDRGVLIRADQVTGVEVFMYLDDPGQFLSKAGNPVSLDLARKAGYDVDGLTKQRLLRQRLVEAEAKIRAELEVGEENRKIVLEKGDFRVLDIGFGRHQVLHKDGEVLTQEPLPLEQAKMLLNELSPEGELKTVS